MNNQVDNDNLRKEFNSFKEDFEKRLILLEKKTQIFYEGFKSNRWINKI